MNWARRLLFQVSLRLVHIMHALRFWLRKAMGDTRVVHGVRIIVDDGDNHVLLVRHWYAPGVWTLPGGGIKPTESVDQAARRELEEETGCTVRDASAPLEVLGVYTGQRPDDQVAVVIVTAFNGRMRMLPDIEIMERGFFDMRHLPPNTSPANQKRVAEYHEGKRNLTGTW